MTETDIQISSCIDWVRCTFDHGIDVNRLFPAIPAMARTGEINDHGYYGYNRSMPLAAGGALMWHSEKPEMKYCIELPGQVLAEVRRDGFEVEEIFNHWIAMRIPGTTYKRVDFAFDILNGGAQVKDLWTAIERKRVKMRAHTARFLRSYESDYNADTVEIGARGGSPLFLRTYDKAAQTGMLWLSWVRIELENTKQRANSFVASALKHGRDQTGRTLIKEMIKTKVGWFNAALDGELAPHVEIPRPDAKPDKFVMETIVPFIRNHAHELSEDSKRILLANITNYIQVY